MSNERTVEAELLEYVDRKRLEERRDRCQEEVADFADRLYQKYGMELAVLSLIKYVGILLVHGFYIDFVRIGCRHLAKQIFRSTLKKWLTLARVLQ
jgi:hypothetical protein